MEMNYGEIIKEARIRKGYTQCFLSNVIGMGESYIQNVEGNHKKINKRCVSKLEELLDITIPPEIILLDRKYKGSGIIKEARIRKRYTQAFICRRLGIAKSVCNGIDIGSRTVPKNIVSKLEELLDITIPPEMISNAYNSKRKTKNFSQTAKYGTEIKDYVRGMIAEYVTPDSKILTLQSWSGMCVKEFIKHGAIPSNITCVEKDSKTMLDYKSLMLGTNNHTGTLLNYLLYTKETFDVAFLDFCGTLTDTTASEIKIAGTMVNDVIGITLNVAYRVKNSRYNEEIVESCVQLLPEFNLHKEPYYYTDKGKRSEMVFLLFRKMKHTIKTPCLNSL